MFGAVGISTAMNGKAREKKVILFPMIGRILLNKRLLTKAIGNREDPKELEIGRRAGVYIRFYKGITIDGPAPQIDASTMV